jgi:hypothetical protein
MANVKISELSSAGTLTGSEEVAIVQSSATVKTTTQDIANLASGGASYTSYVAKISGSAPVVSSVFENTTGLTFTWASGSTFGEFDDARDYTTTISSVDPAKIAVFATGQVIIINDKGITAILPRPAYTITAINSTTAKIDITYFVGQLYTPGTPIMVEIRIYP